VFKVSSQPQSICSVIGNSFQLYKNSFLKLLPLTLLFGLISILPSKLVGEVIHLKQGTWQIYIDWSAASLTFGLQFISFFLFMSMLFLTHQMMYQLKATYSNTLFVACKKTIPCFIVSILAFALFIVGFALLLFPGIYIYVSFLFVTLAVLFDNRSIISALKYSYSLVKNNWWRTFCILIFNFIVVIPIVYVINKFWIPALFIFQYKLNTIPIWTYMIHGLITILIVPWIITLLLVQYHDLKLRSKLKQVLY
jgi:hypothetical protein